MLNLNKDQLKMLKLSISAKYTELHHRLEKLKMVEKDDILFKLSYNPNEKKELKKGLSMLDSLSEIISEEIKNIERK